MKVYIMKMYLKFWLTLSFSGVSTQIRHKWNNFCVFLVQVRMSLFGIDGEISSKMRMISLFRSHDSLLRQCKVCHCRQTTYLSVFGLWKEYSKRGSRLCTFYFRRNWTLFWLKGKHVFHFYMLDNTHQQKSLVACCRDTILSFCIWLIQMGP